MHFFILQVFDYQIIKKNLFHTLANSRLTYFNMFSSYMRKYMILYETKVLAYFLKFKSQENMHGTYLRW